MTKMEKMNIQRECIKRFMHYFKYNKLDVNNTVLLENMEKCITRVAKLEIEQIEDAFNPNIKENGNSVLIEFINDPNDKYSGKYRNLYLPNEKPIIKYNIDKIYRGLESKNELERLEQCKKLFKIVFHEIQHHIQYLMTQSNQSSTENLMYARDSVLQKYLPKDFYKTNYLEYMKENSANLNAYKRYLEITKDKDNRILDLIDIEIGKKATSRYKVNSYSKDKKAYYKSNGLLEINDVIIPILDHLICDRSATEFLEIFPILQKEYNLDGSKKSAIELIENMKKEVDNISKQYKLSLSEKTQLTKNTQEMYYELIYRALNMNKSKQMICVNRKMAWVKEIVNKMINKRHLFMKFINQVFSPKRQKKQDENVQLENYTNTQLAREQIAEINKVIQKIGKYETKVILENIDNYFQSQKQDKIRKSENMAKAQERQDDNYSKNPWDMYQETKERLAKDYRKKHRFITNVSNQLEYIEKQNVGKTTKKYNKISQEIINKYKYNVGVQIVDMKVVDNNKVKNKDDEQSL